MRRFHEGIVIHVLMKEISNGRSPGRLLVSERAVGMEHELKRFANFHRRRSRQAIRLHGADDCGDLLGGLDVARLTLHRLRDYIVAQDITLESDESITPLISFSRRTEEHDSSPLDDAALC